MRVLFDIVHPADVLFFQHSIRALKTRGDDIMILSRQKDIACDLLDEFGFPHLPVSTAGAGTLKLATELIMRDFAVIKAARAFKPDVMIGFGGVAISHAGRLLGIPSVSFYDTDTAKLQNKITLPFITHLYVPESFRAKTPKNRTTRFRGIKELAYLHPDVFRGDDTIALKRGWVPDKDNYFIRAVKWTANHDIGKSGWSDKCFSGLVSYLSARGRVHISSERVLPAHLEEFRYKGAKSEVHHLMSKCRLYVGESATMAQEAALLKVPAIYDGRDTPSVTLDLVHAGLIQMPSAEGEGGLMSLVEAFLSQSPDSFDNHYQKYMKDHPNLTDYTIKALERHAKA